MGLYATTRVLPIPISREGGDEAKQAQHEARSGCTDSDALLLARIAGQDEDALRLLFRRYARSVRAVGHRVLRDSGEVDDLVQEVFLYIYRKCTVFDSSKSSARSWIFQVAYTQAFLHRRRLMSKAFAVSGIADSLHEVESQTNSGADYDQSVEGLLGRKALASLSEDQRETLRLYFFEGYTFTEIAQKLGQSFYNARHHYYRGLETLRHALRKNAFNRR